MFHKRRNHFAIKCKDDNYWKDIREKFVELHETMNYITQLNEKLKLSQVDFPIFEDDQPNDPSVEKEGLNEGVFEINEGDHQSLREELKCELVMESDKISRLET